jgi:phage terminase large subunit
LIQNQELEIRTPRVFLPLLGSHRFKGAEGGRGSGKSHFYGELAVEDCLSQHIRMVCARETQISIADSSKRLIEDKIHDLGLDSLFKITDKEITGPNDSLIVFKGLQNHTSTSIKSLEGFNRLWVEEAQTVSNRSMELAIPTFRTPGSQCWFSWNANQPTDPVDKFFNENKGDPDFVFVKANYPDNPWFPEELRRDMERDKRRDLDKYRHVWLGEYVTKSKATVFNNWRVEEFERPRGTVFRLGADWGFSVDPSVLIRCSIEGNLLFVDYEAYQVGCEIVNLPELFMQVPEAEKWPITADSARPETISHMKKNGFPRIRSAIKGAGSLEEGVEFLQSFDIIVHPRCENLINELTLYKYKVDRLTDDVLPILEDKDNHIIDSLRYACEGARRADKNKVVDFKPQLRPRIQSSSSSWMG